MKLRLSSLILAALLAGACAKHPVPMQPVPVPTTVNSDSIARARLDAQRDSLRAIAERERLEREARTNATELSVIMGTVYFDFDKSDLSDSAKTQLDAKVPLLAKRPTLRIRVTGHTDDVGSAEYNLALGLRRAAEVKAYLVAGGVNASRIDIFSLGEEQPAVPGTSEEARAKNRRAEFVQVGPSGATGGGGGGGGGGS